MLGHSGGRSPRVPRTVSHLLQLSLIYASRPGILRSPRSKTFFGTSYPALTSTSVKSTRWRSLNCLEDGAGSLKASPPALDVLAQLLDTSIEASSLTPTDQHSLRSGGGIEVFRRRFGAVVTSGRERFLSEINSYMAGMSRMEMAEFEIIGIEEITSPLPKVNVDIRYDFVGMPTNTGREERVGQWRTQWVRGESGAWRVLRWEATDETVSRARGPVFVDVTAQTLGHTESYRNQMLRGVDHWRTVLDGACGIDVYGNTDRRGRFRQ